MASLLDVIRVGSRFESRARQERAEGLDPSLGLSKFTLPAVEAVRSLLLVLLLWDLPVIILC